MASRVVLKDLIYLLIPKGECRKLINHENSFLINADRSSMLKNFREIFFVNPEKLSPEFMIWNLGFDLAASAYFIISCAIELKRRRS
jgi:hypothetical protein